MPLRSRRAVVLVALLAAGVVAVVLVSRASTSSAQRDGCSLRSAHGQLVPLGSCDIITPHVKPPRGLQQPAGVVTVPSVIGLQIGDAVAELNQQGLRVQSTGTGAVLSQIPAPGALVARSGIVELTGSS
jgi:hypothetical protein